MANEKIDSVRSLEENLKRQDYYAKTRHVTALEYQITNLIPTAVISSLNSSLMTCNWSDEDVALIRKIVTVLADIHVRAQELENLSQPLMTLKKELNSYLRTSVQSQMTTDGGAPHGNKQESAERRDD